MDGIAIHGLKSLTLCGCHKRVNKNIHGWRRMWSDGVLKYSVRPYPQPLTHEQAMAEHAHTKSHTTSEPATGRGSSCHLLAAGLILASRHRSGQQADRTQARRRTSTILVR